MLQSKAVRLPPLAARPNWIIGRVVFENGQPVPNFKVNYDGMNGKFDPLFENSTLAVLSRGKRPRRTAGITGMNGQYAIHVTGGDVWVTGVHATATLKFDDLNWGLTAWPTDNIADGSGLASGLTSRTGDHSSRGCRTRLHPQVERSH